ncbi:hypothetical protein SCHPADRAFT_480474 [Schizopora paradoxa]|uniref:Uncharacterized protein n=1 Tax=Schizopora paradoxa TaxID=27342 RepID=A0A0H2RP27_9AGAM|nr:hypothetical protein SCHPADRAFT_480474 [Schizopora paradoxa]
MFCVSSQYHCYIYFPVYHPRSTSTCFVHFLLGFLFYWSLVTILDSRPPEQCFESPLTEELRSDEGSRLCRSICCHPCNV